MEENFFEYMKFFNEQSTKEKESIILEQLKMLSEYSNDMCKSLNISNIIIPNENLSNKDYNQEEFLEALIIYINSIQNSLNDYNIGIDKITDSLLNEDN